MEIHFTLLDMNSYSGGGFKYFWFFTYIRGEANLMGWKHQLDMFVHVFFSHQTVFFLTLEGQWYEVAPASTRLRFLFFASKWSLFQHLWFYLFVHPLQQRRLCVRDIRDDIGDIPDIYTLEISWYWSMVCGKNVSRFFLSDCSGAFTQWHAQVLICYCFSSVSHHPKDVRPWQAQHAGLE